MKIQFFRNYAYDFNLWIKLTNKRQFNFYKLKDNCLYINIFGFYSKFIRI